ncbi:MAG: hypothetical protein DSZ29_05010 [Aquificaceae bacterium]|nr:MAG: hypothetical protein DSZ29_05010 [Aquificaceae bacterium]
MKKAQTVYLVDGSRTPFSRQIRRTSKNIVVYDKLDLALTTARTLLLKQGLSATLLDSIIIASHTHTNNDNLARQLSQRLQCNSRCTPNTFTAGENCGLQALSYAHQQITFGKKSLILISGVETAETPPIALNTELSQWIRDWKNSQGFRQKIKVFNKLHTKHFHKDTAKDDTKDQYYELHKEIAEKTAYYFSLSTKAMTEYVKLSQRRLKYAQRNQLIKGIVPIFYPDGTSLHRDEDIISTNSESLKQTILSGNPPTGIISKASIMQKTEGASSLLLASQEALNKFNLTPLARLSTPTQGNNDQAIEDLLSQNNYQADDINYWEWDETSAAEILALEYKPLFKSTEAFQSLNSINIDGGSLSLGSPNCANKLRCVLQLAHILKRNQAHTGICHFSSANQQNNALLLHSIGDHKK